MFLECEKEIRKVVNKNLMSPLTEIQMETIVKHLNSIRDLSQSSQGLLKQSEIFSKGGQSFLLD